MNPIAVPSFRGLKPALLGLVIFTYNFSSRTSHKTTSLRADILNMYSSEIGIVAESVDLNPMKEGSSPKKKFLFFRTIALVMVVALLSFLVISMILQSEMSHTGVGQQSSKLGGYFCPPRRNYQDQSSTIGIYIRAFLTSLMLISVSHRVAGYLCGIVVRHCLCKIPGSFQVMALTIFHISFHVSPGLSCVRRLTLTKCNYHRLRSDGWRLG